MQEAVERLGRWAASAAMLAVLGFGATQALASPLDARDVPAACNGGECNRFCKSIGATGGRCAADQCFCYWIIPLDPR